MTSTLTITEALSEVNLITKKLAGKQDGIFPALVVPAHVPDPYKDNLKYVEAEMQSVADLQVRLLKIRSGIQRANLETSITINDMTLPITSWLAWRKEVYPTATNLLQNIRRKVVEHQAANQSRPALMQKQEDGALKTEMVTFKYGVSLPEITKKLETLVDTHEKLDGQLSLKNATVTITI